MLRRFAAFLNIAKSLEPLPLGLASDWIAILLRRLYAIRKVRAQELAAIRSTFVDPEMLLELYIEPDCQLTNPADFDEIHPAPTWCTRIPIRNRLNDFFRGPALERDGRNVLFVLSDAGMGKSSLLTVLKVASLAVFWPRHLTFALLRLGPSSLDDIRKIENRRDTVLLLDALDEDPHAFGRVEERIRNLLLEAASFHRVLITCRTQFFPEGGAVPIEAFGRVEVAGFVCNLIYLSPFSDEQIDHYLRKLYPGSLWRSLLRTVGRGANSKIERARSILPEMKSLAMRPLLLAYIDDLAKYSLTTWRTFRLYDALIDTWLLREERKQNWRGRGPSREELRQACEAVAVYLQKEGRRELTTDELEEIAVSRPEALLIGAFELGGRSLLNRNSAGYYRFSHYSIQEFLVASLLVKDTHSGLSEHLRITEELLGFVTSWVSEAPAERWKEVWHILRVDPSSPVLLQADFHDSDFSGTPRLGALLATVKNRNFERSRFVGADLEGADLSGARMAHSDLSRAELRQANLSKALLIRSNMNACSAEGASFVSAILTEADLRGANLRGANLHFAMLKDANLSGADLEDADLTFTDLRGANLSEVRGLSQKQIDSTHGDETTILARGFSIPDRWSLPRTEEVGGR